MRHRTDIDGLRALAVLPILLFHAGISALSGGFTGVDIFFVISGFLITGIISREMDDHRFSVLDFYHRRVVRIFPALIVLLVAVLAWGSHALLAEELRGAAASAASAMAFLSNIYFWNDADYFAGAAEAKPLLHTWSLGVEEQFYIFYPLLLIALRRFAPTRITPILVLITMGSFAISLAQALRAPESAFYLLPSRAWELGLGALIAIGAFPRIEAVRHRNAASLAGLAAIAIGLVVIRPSAMFPAPWALLPCGGAALLIAYGEGSLTSRLLSAAPIRWVGAISYSLYLWHWPIITFYRLDHGMALKPPATVALIVASIVAAALSYYLVEQPFLRRYRRARAAPVVAAGAASLAAVLALAVTVNASADAIVRNPAPVRRIAAYADYRDLPDYAYQFRKGPCFVGEGQAFDAARCLRIVPGKHNVVLLGDSHAAQYWRAVALRFPDDNLMQATASGCRPTIALIGAARCTAVVDLVLNRTANLPALDAVILAGRWKTEDIPSLVQTVRMLKAKGLDVTVFGPTSEYDGELPRILARAMLRNDLALVDRFRVRERDTLDRRMRPAIEAAGARYVSEVEAECPNGRCRLFDSGGGPLHFDYGHLTLRGSRDIVAHLPPMTQDAS